MAARIPPPRRSHRPRLVALAAACCLAALISPGAVAAQGDERQGDDRLGDERLGDERLGDEDRRPTFSVRYRSADTVYLDAGRRAGLSVGDRLELSRDGEVVAIVEVVFVAGSSASARPVEERAEIRPGDLARPLGELASPDDAEGRTPAPADRRTAADRPARSTASPAPRPPRRRRTRFSGVASVDYETFSDDDPDGRDHDQTTARLSLRGRDLGGLPLDLRLRLRARRLDRARALSGGVPASEDRDRLYELSLSYRPESGRFAIAAGRLGAGPFTGIGYLDGVSGRYRVLPGWQVGGFFGQRPEIADLAFDSAGTKLGVFTRWTPPDSGRWEVFVAGVREEDDAGVSRDLAILETRLGAADGRWSLFQRAELDLGADGLGVGGNGVGGNGTGNGSSNGDGSQLTQLALALTARLGEHSRFVVSYDRYDPRLLFDDELDTPADRFRDLLRQGLRARLELGRESGFEFSLSGGVREGEGDDDSTYSLGLGARRLRPRGLSLSVDLLGFSNPLTEGALATLRSRYGFAGGHSIGLVLGATGYRLLEGDDRISGWARLEGWVELPASLFLRADIELLAGDDAEGQRLRVGLGYRF